MNKKGQVDVKEMAMTLIIAGVVFIVLLLVFSSVSNSADGLFDLDANKKTDETFTLTADAPNSDNSTLLAESGYVEDSESVVNNSVPHVKLVRDIDYVITLIGASGLLDTRANFTLLNVSNGTSNNDGGVGNGFNASELLINYTFNSKSEAGLSVDVIETTVLDSFSLAVISLIVLAAVAILAILFRLGT
ncbi:MAG: hypothetical protein IH934_04690 [Nanoarchaeota archaeon]|nr:hypothetical protein [Nanoarchaeota archaeon]